MRSARKSSPESLCVVRYRNPALTESMARLWVDYDTRHAEHFWASYSWSSHCQIDFMSSGPDPSY